MIRHQFRMTYERNLPNLPNLLAMRTDKLAIAYQAALHLAASSGHTDDHGSRT